MFVHPFMCPRCFLFSPDRTDFLHVSKKSVVVLRSETPLKKKKSSKSESSQKRSKSDRILENVTFLRAAITHLRL